MLVVRLEHELSDPDADALAATLLDERHYDIVLREDADVYKPNGEVLLKFRKGVLPAESAKAAYKSLRAAASTDNRGMSGGVLSKKAKDDDISRPIGGKTQTRYRPIKEDGSVSKTSYAKAVHSGIVGYFDRYARIPYCRTTAYTLTKPERWVKAMPFIRAVDAVFASEAPDRYAAQKAMIAKTHPDFYIDGTAFTTITVNKNWQTAVHKDSGDYADGFGVLTVLRAGNYEGGYLVFPKYRVAVDIQSCDVLLADVHEWHGNTALKGRGKFERISCVFYYRAKMYKCGSAVEELERAKNRKQGDPLYDPDPDE